VVTRLSLYKFAATQAKLSSLLFPDLGTLASAQVLKFFDLLSTVRETFTCFD